MSIQVQMMYSLVVHHLSKRFAATQALAEVSLDFPAGLMHGIIGPEGAGKTTLMRVILGLLKPQQGAVRFYREGREVPFAEVRPQIAYLPSAQALYPDLSIDEHLRFFKSLYGISSTDYRLRREELLHLTRLEEFVARPAGNLSGGMYKKLGLMCALLRSPQIMLLDEPTNGVDPISRREFWQMLYRLADQNLLILVSTSYMDEAERCAMVHLLEAGHVIAEGSPRSLLERETVTSFDALFLKRAQLDEVGR